MKSSLHLVWFLVSASDAIADILVAVYFLRLKKRFGYYMALMMLGVSVEAVIAAMSLLVFWAVEIDVAPAFAITRTIGRTIKSVGSWLFYAYLFYFMNGDMGDDAVTPDKAGLKT